MNTLAALEISKSYGPVEVLHGCSLELQGGHITGLVGSNGAGKSTLIKILSGAEQPSSGRLMRNGEPVRFADPRDANRKGIAVVHQNIAMGLVPNWTIAENLLLDLLGEKKWPLMLKRSWLERSAAELLEGTGFQFDLAKRIDELSVAGKQEVLLARALGRQAEVLILDEPTASLSTREVEVLFERLRLLRSQGIAVMIVTHRLHEAAEVCDEIVVLRDGRVVDRLSSLGGNESFDMTRVINGMLGVQDYGLRDTAVNGNQGTASANSTAREGPSIGTVAVRSGNKALEVVDVSALPGGPPIRLSVDYGEILGLTGLVGSGKTELIEQMVGVRPLGSGTVLRDGKPWRAKSMEDAISKGVGFVPEDRARQALFPGWSVAHHRSIPFLESFSRWGLVRSGSEEYAGNELISRFGIRGGSTVTPVNFLSGGNQQKVVVSRWLAQECDVLVLDEPFIGVDIGARTDLGRLLRDFAHVQHKAILMTSSDPRELVEVVDRIVVLKQGAIVWEGKATEGVLEDIVAAIAGDQQGVQAIGAKREG
ncbi:MAG: sugar ABC transporter ATP-binding protein [Actinobacteria bacterium]|nr:sugar ABC transporter ATP-binding protein [Actinomycetota bacterium]MCL6095044.1 sugar ABC transporter ATP-binding protein [Actinomycetota bacterium]